MSGWDGSKIQIFQKSMEAYKVRYKNSKFSNEKVELDGKSFVHCEFENCIIILERGETEISRCSFKNCKLILKGNAYTVGKIIKLFTGKNPLKVLDMEEPPISPFPLEGRGRNDSQPG
jgi:hypothetical protein